MEKIEEEKSTTNPKAEMTKEESLMIENNSDATFTSTEPSQLPEEECKLPRYIVQCLRGHDQGVIALALHPLQRDLLVSGGMDDRLLFWSISEERILGEMNLDETINQLEFSKDGRFLGICVMGGKFVVFEFSEVKEEKTDSLNIDQESLHLKTEKFEVRESIFVFYNIALLSYILNKDEGQIQRSARRTRG